MFATALLQILRPDHQDHARLYRT
ncbi:MAG: hypothetical protein ACLVJH_13520 [Faecalibacterium prausnitzii]